MQKRKKHPSYNPSIAAAATTSNGLIKKGLAKFPQKPPAQYPTSSTTNGNKPKNRWLDESGKRTRDLVLSFKRLSAPVFLLLYMPLMILTFQTIPPGKDSSLNKMLNGFAQEKNDQWTENRTLYYNLHSEDIATSTNDEWKLAQFFSSSKVETKPRKNRHPKIVGLTYIADVQGGQEQLGTFLEFPQPANFNPTNDSVPLNAPIIQPDWFEKNAVQYLANGDHCEPMYDWQISSYQNCNDFHNLDLSTMRMINKGGSRIAFEMGATLDGQITTFVYKTIKYSHEFSESKVEQQRKDALMLGKLTSSKFIPNLHGYCGVGVLMDYMPEGNMHDYIKGVRIDGGSSLAPVDKLRIAIHIATSVADLHDAESNGGIPTFFHNDICCHQYLFQDGIFKLNDFNYAQPMLYKKGTKDVCLRKSSGMSIWKGRSLEEQRDYARRQKFIDLSEAQSFSGDKVDVWMMGNLMYIIMTDLYTFEWPKTLSIDETAKELVVEGKRSAIPEKIVNSKDPSYVAIMKALDMCWTSDWIFRPAARTVSDYLMGQLRVITGEQNPDLKVVLPMRYEDQKPTDSEFNKFAY